MSEDLDFNLEKLARALRAAPPAPEAEARADALLSAQAEFARLHGASPEKTRTAQGSVTPIRPMSDRREVRRLTGGWTMMQRMTSRAALAAAGGAVAAGLALVLILPQDLNPPEVATATETRVGNNGTAADRPVAAQTAAPVAPAATEGAMPLAPPVGQAVAPPATESAEEAPRTQAASAPVLRPDAADAAAPAARSRAMASDPIPGPEEAPGVSGQAAIRSEAERGPGTAPAPSFARDQVRALAPPESLANGTAQRQPDTEAYPQAQDNPVKLVAEAPVSTFSVDVDTASWAMVRSSILRGTLPPRDAVRVEEMVNYFPYAYPAPGDEAPFSLSIALTQTPWNADTLLLRVGLQGRMPAQSDRPPLNLVLLIDTSGSMDAPDRLPLLKQALRLMLPDLAPEDQVAIVTYAGAVGVALEPTPASNRSAILSALDSLTPGGGTAGQAGLQTAYDLAREMASDGELSRILLATDGDFNIGISDPEALKTYVERQREGGTYLSVLGFGRGNLDDATMQALAQNGNGTAAYVDTLQEAQKVLVDQLAGALFPIADDVKAQVEFNPAEVAEYRLIGYETRALRREDFNNDRVDAGEIGAGLQVTALYEVTPPGSPARLTDPSRYGTDPAGAQAGAGELGFLRLRYKLPGETESRLIEAPISAAPGAADSETAFAAAIAGFGQRLRQSVYLGDWSYAQAIRLAEAAKGPDRFGYRAEAIRLMRLAQSLDR